MRYAIAVGAAVVLAGFTAQDAEKMLDGEWASVNFPIGLSISAAGKSAKVVEAGRESAGPFRIEGIAGGAATVSIAGKRYVLHIRNNGDRLLFAPEGKTDAIIMNRVR